MGSPDSEQDTHKRSDGPIVILVRALLSGRVMRVPLPGMPFLIARILVTCNRPSPLQKLTAGNICTHNMLAPRSSTILKASALSAANGLYQRPMSTLQVQRTRAVRN